MYPVLAVAAFIFSTGTAINGLDTMLKLMGKQSVADWIWGTSTANNRIAELLVE
jgi:hypothetical protein